MAHEILSEAKWNFWVSGIPTKFAAYSGWCYVGLRWFDPSREVVCSTILAAVDGVFLIFLAALTEQRGEKFNTDLFVVYVPFALSRPIMLLILRRQERFLSMLLGLRAGEISSGRYPLGIMEGG
jgi:hypothetical protein